MALVRKRGEAMDTVLGTGGLSINWESFRILEKNGYTPGGDCSEHNRAAVLERLQELCESETIREERILWWEKDVKDREDEEVYFVYPVTLALLLEEYDCAEKLFDKGYEVEYLLPDKQFYCYRNENGKRTYAIHRTQVLMAKDTIPERLLGRIYGELSVVQPVFSFQEDIWDNPLLTLGANEAVRYSLPAMHGLDHMYAKHSSWLEGMLAEGSFSKDKMAFLSPELRHKLMRRLLKYLKGMGEDLAQYIKIFEPDPDTMNVCKESRNEVKYWMKLLPALEEACSMDEVSGKAFWESVVTLMGKLPKAQQLFLKSQRNELFEELMEVAGRSMPEDYTVEEYLKYMYRQKTPEEYGYYLKLWKQITGEPVVLDRMGATLWDMLDNIFGETHKFSTNAREDRREERLLWGITLMESVDEMVAVDEAESEYLDSGVLTELICILLDFDSEELILACLKNKFVPEGAIEACMKSALKFQKLRVLPALILAKSREKKKE